MTVLVRDLRPGDPRDAEGVVGVRRSCLPFMISTVPALAAELDGHPDRRHRVLLTEEDGVVTGTAQVGIAHDADEPGQGYVNAYVLPGHRSRGAGELLLRAAEEHLEAVGARTAFAWALDEPAGHGFALRHGYAASRSAHFLRRSLTGPELPDPGPVPAGVELLPSAAFADDPRPVYLLDAAVSVDEPGDIGVRLENAGYEDWLRQVWGNPTMDHELTTVAVVDGVPAAFSALVTDGEGRCSSAMTGTRREFRGRGLAKLTKSVALAKARAAGCTEAFTGNDTGNGPMLAVNSWFGYEVCATEVRYAKSLAAAGPR
ncbi:GNAT family N-acetyltransferase [Streptomyces sp. NPDC097619]|uniref:GNAT family N-acetyltransferase n=1 Tax=Streptomyces sp. NPDC097619 TaxID=3157228 RepID=UPI00331B861B